MTAVEKLMILRAPAVLGLFVAHIKLRAIQEPLDPDALTKAAHELLELASQAERAQMRERMPYGTDVVAGGLAVML